MSEIKEFTISADDVGVRLDKFLLSKLDGYTRSHIKLMIENGDILVLGEKVKSGYALKAHDVVRVEIVPVKEVSISAEDVPFSIVYEDDDLVVVNKPQGVVVHPCTSTKSGTLVNGLMLRVSNLSGINGELRPGIVHRLDKDTSGLLVVAKNNKSHLCLAEQIKNKTCKRCYLAILDGNLKEDKGTVATKIGRDKKDRKKMAVTPDGRDAVTNYVVLERFKHNCLVEFSLQTGRTHQIRVHSKYLGHPVVGDKVYGKPLSGLNGQLLHAYKLSFTHPTTNELMTFEAELPSYFSEYLERLRKSL